MKNNYHSNSNGAGIIIENTDDTSTTKVFIFINLTVND